MQSTSKQNSYSIDRGWSWVVLTCGTLSIMILGLPYVIGMFNVIFLEVFGQSHQMTAWISAAQTSLFALAAPLSTMLEKYIGSRLTVILGGLLGATGFFLTYFATSLIYVFITFGVVVGVAHGIVYLQFVMAMGKYFRKYRNLAFGVVSAGFGVSALVLPQLIQLTNQAYGWRGCMLIMSGIYLQIVICGALLTPQPMVEDDAVIAVEVETDLEENQGFESVCDGVTKEHYESIDSEQCIDGNKGDLTNPDHLKGNSHLSTSTRSEPNCESVCQIYPMNDQPSAKFTQVKSTFPLSLDEGDLTNQDDPKINSNHSLYAPSGQNSESVHQIYLINDQPRAESSIQLRLTDIPVSAAGSLTSLTQIDKPQDHISNKWDNTNNLESADQSQHKSACTTSSLDIIKPKRHWLLDIRIVLFVLCPFCIQGSSFISYIHFPDFFKKQGAQEKDMAVIYVVIGGCSIIGRLLVGASVNSPDMNKLIVYTASGAIASVFIFVCPFMASNFCGQIFFAFGFAFYGAVYHVLLAPLTLEEFGIKKLSNIYALENFSAGLGSLVGPPFAGWLYDISGNYWMVFTVAGVVYLAGSLPMMFIPIIKSRRKQQLLPIK